MVELDIDIEIEEIKNMSKGKFKALVNEKVTRKAFIYLIERKSSRNFDRAKGKHLEYDELNISDYLTPTENELSIDERKWVFKCRIEDIDINTNRKWNNEESKCMKCPNTIMNQKHLLEGKYLSGKNEMLSYIPRYEHLFAGELEEEISAGY